MIATTARLPPDQTNAPAARSEDDEHSDDAEQQHRRQRRAHAVEQQISRVSTHVGEIARRARGASSRTVQARAGS
jgi:hypothetical protein